MHESTATALLALWNDVDPAFDAAYHDWHANEHVPERLTVPGIVWASRWACSGAAAVPPCEMPRYLTLYGLRDADVVKGEPYQQLLREPTPASRAMRPALRNLSRWICRLDVCEGLGHASRLAIRTFDRMPNAASSLRGDALVALVAERLPNAPELPWLESGQTRPVEGRVLVGLLVSHVDGTARAPAPGFTMYERLPVGHRSP